MIRSKIKFIKYSRQITSLILIFSLMCVVAFPTSAYELQGGKLNDGIVNQYSM